MFFSKGSKAEWVVAGGKEVDFKVIGTGVLEEATGRTGRSILCRQIIGR